MTDLVPSWSLSKRSMFSAALAFAIALPLVAPQVGDAAKRPKGAVKLKASQMKTVGKVRCGKVRGAWYPGTKLAKNYFVTHAQQAKNYKALAKKKKGSAKRKATRQASSYSSRAKSQLSACRRTSASAPTPSPTTPSNALRFSVDGAAGLGLTPPATALSRGARTSQTSGSGSNLQAISPSGGLSDAVTSGKARISRFLIGPGGNVYVLFGYPGINLENTLLPPTGSTGCLLAEVDRATGVPTCIAKDLSYISWDSSGSGQARNRPIQFDGSGAAYYLGSTSSGRQVLRKYANGTTTDLVSDQVQVNDFLVLNDGTVFITGTTAATSQSWVRLVTPQGALRTVVNQSANWMQLFSDGNVYMGLWNPPNMGVRRYLTGSGQLDATFWTSWGGSSDPSYNDTTGLCGVPGRMAFCGSAGTYSKAFFRTTDGKTFGIPGGGGGDSLLTQYFPAIDFPSTLVKNVTVARGVITNLILAGTDASNRNTLTLFNTSNGSETRLLPPENEIEVYHVTYSASQNSVLFDGLRFSDNRYVLGQVNLSTGSLAVTSTLSVKWEDFEAFN